MKITKLPKLNFQVILILFMKIINVST